MRIIKEGNKPKRSPTLYFHCNHCGCEFEALTNECRYVDGLYDYDSGYVYVCPTCKYNVWSKEYVTTITKGD